MFSKLFERLIFNKISSYTYSNISIQQHGFTKARSTTSNLTSFFHTLTSLLPSCNQVDVIYTDIKSAFEKVDHTILLAKLHDFGFPLPLIKLFASYLSMRKLRVKYRTTLSSAYYPTSSVPQGSLLGNIFFLIVIDGITKVIQHSSYQLYADDVKIYRQITSQNDVILLQKDLDCLQLWLSENKLSFCPLKCELVRYSRRHNIIQSSYTINNITLKVINQKKDLGVYFDHKLNFGRHIECTINSCYQILGFIMRTLRSTDDPDPYLLLFKSLVLSKLEYASVIWFPKTQKGIHSLESVQALFTRRLFHRLNGFYPAYPEGISYSDLRENLCLQSIENRHEIQSLLTLYKIISGQIDSMDLVGSIHFKIPCNRTRAYNPINFFEIPSHSHSDLSPLFNLLKIYNIYSENLDLSVSFSKFSNQVAKCFIPNS